MLILDCEWCNREFHRIQKRRYCSRQCARYAHAGYANPAVFWSKTIERENGCIEWRGPFAHNGYGRTYLANRKRCAAHRLAWILTNGDVPDGMIVCHRCDNPPCCNPEHLFLGTNKLNSEDMVRKGRHRTNNPRGLKAKGAKFTAEQIRTIREQAGTAKSMRELGRQWGVRHHTIIAIVRRETYADVQ